MSKDDLSGADIKAICTEAVPHLLLPRPHRDWAHPCHICDWGSPVPHLHRDWGSPVPRPHRSATAMRCGAPSSLSTSRSSAEGMISFHLQGMLALRERRMKVIQADFKKAKEKALYRKNDQGPAGLYL